MARAYFFFTSRAFGKKLPAGLPRAHGRYSAPSAAMSAHDDEEVILATVLGAVGAHQRARKRRKVALVIALQLDQGEDDERERHTHHFRMPRTPLSWAARQFMLKRQYRIRNRMPKACFATLVADVAPYSSCGAGTSATCSVTST